MYNPPAYVWALTIGGPTAIAAARPASRCTAARCAQARDASAQRCSAGPRPASRAG